jgi:MOSC domain-containing protein YiiM
VNASPARVLSVNRSIAVRRQIRGKWVLTAMGKQPVDGAVAVGPLGLEGDEQADASVHGGIAKAVYAYPREHAAFWRRVRAQAGVAAFDAELPFGLLGENLTTEGLTEERLWIGDRLHLPGCLLAVSAPRRPCFKFNAALGFRHAAKMMIESGWCGAYLAVIVPGQVCAGDSIEVEPGPREVNLRELFFATAG